MTHQREDDESPSGNHPLVGGVGPTSGGPWNPLASFRKTISAAQRIELLSMKVPVLPPEDFMDTAEFQRVQAARSRRFLPLVIGISALFLALLCAGLWSWLQVAPTPGEPSIRPPAAAMTVPNAAHSPVVPTRESPTAKPTPLPTTDKTPSLATPASKPRIAAASPAREPPAPRESLAPRERPPSRESPSPRESSSSRKVGTVPPSKLPTAPSTTTTSPNPAPAASGINFWTQPR